MRIEKFREFGHDMAMMGMSLSNYKGDLPAGLWWDAGKFDKALPVADRLAARDRGHNKFLRAMHVQMVVTAPRYWWQEFDQYKVGCTTLSASTMHTLGKTPPSKEDFAPGTSWLTRAVFNIHWMRHRRNIPEMKKHLPESFLQTRVVDMNYAALREIYHQRKDHKLPEWGAFLRYVVSHVRFPGYVLSAEQRRTTGMAPSIGANYGQRAKDYSNTILHEWT